MPIDYDLFRKSLEDGTANEVLAMTGGVAVETLLEEQDDDRVWLQLNFEEQDRLAEMMQEYAQRVGGRLVRDDASCIVYFE